MVAIKSHQANAFLKDLKRSVSAVLFYGADAGLVSERAATLAKRLAERDDPPARSSASTMPRWKTIPTASSSSSRPRRCSAGPRSCAR